MKKQMGRPKVGAQNAKGILFSARFTPPEASQITEAMKSVGKSKSEWIRNAMLTAANKQCE